MQKVGILTYHNVPNYGAIMQAWSLAQQIQRLGCQVEIIDYRPHVDARYYLGTDLRSKWFLLRLLRTWRLHRFGRRNLPLTKRVIRHYDQLAEFVGDYDTLICGSDQIWKTDGFRGFDKSYFLDFPQLTGVRRIAYAASCGDLTTFGSHADQVRDALAQFDHISVRDTNSAERLAELGIGPVQRVVDPTLIADFSPLIEPSERRPHLLVYGGIRRETIPLIQELADQTQMEVISVGGRLAIARSSRALVDPRGWLNCFAQAGLVVSSYFHGVAVAIALRKPLIAIPQPQRRMKVCDLLESLGLQHRLVDATAQQSPLPVDDLLESYQDAEASIRAAVDQSMQFLSTALDG